METLRIFPDPVLRKVCEPVRHFDKELQALTRRMSRIMKSQAHGIGIAAPQIGISKQIAIVDVSPRVPTAGALILINPQIMQSWDELPSREGCMSVPDYTGLLKRFARVHVSWQDEYGVFHEQLCSGIEAVCVQHEIDHLQGRLFIDRISSLKRDLIPRHFKRRS